ncbi:MAG: hypothetical protein ABI369_16235 [Acetobacteraceae bacterium]
MTLGAPRLLPVTIAAMAALLALKGAGLVFAASAAPEPAASLPAVAAPPPAHATPSPAPKPPANATGAVAPAEPPKLEAEAAPGVLVELRKRREELDAREAALAARDSVLAATAQKLDQRVAELKALQTRLEQIDAARRKQDDADWLGLVSLYEKMKPREAARIFDDLEMAVLVKLLDHMNERRAAAILAAMHPDKARETTTELASLREKRAAAMAAAN